MAIGPLSSFAASVEKSDDEVQQEIAQFAATLGARVSKLVEQSLKEHIAATARNPSKGLEARLPQTPTGPKEATVEAARRSIRFTPASPATSKSLRDAAEPEVQCESPSLSKVRPSVNSSPSRTMSHSSASNGVGPHVLHQVSTPNAKTLENLAASMEEPGRAGGRGSRGRTSVHSHTDPDINEERPSTAWLFMILEAVVLPASVATNIVAGVQADVDWEHWLLVDLALLLVFWIDIWIKLYILGPHGYFMGTLRYRKYQTCFWNRFDFSISVLVSMQLVLSSFSIFNNEVVLGLVVLLRLLRLLRLAASTRLEFLRDFSAIVHGLLWGLRPLLWAVLILLTVSYSCGLGMRMTVGDPESRSPIMGPRYFGDIRKATFNAFRCLQGDCTTELGEPIVLLIGQDYGYVAKFVYATVVLIITVGLANVVLAIFTERIIEGSRFNESLRQRLRLKEADFLKRMESNLLFIQDYYTSRDEEPPLGIDASGQSHLLVDRDCFNELMEHPSFQKVVMRRMGVKMDDFVSASVDCFFAVSPHGTPISVHEMLEVLCSFRGEARVTLQRASISLQVQLLSCVQELLKRSGPRTSGGCGHVENNTTPRQPNSNTTPSWAKPFQGDFSHVSYV